jgi:hypothetical protein
MIKQSRDMPNLSWLDLLGAAQNEVVILRPLEAGAKSDTLDQLRFENPEVREKILSQKEWPIPVGFEVRVAAAPGFSCVKARRLEKVAAFWRRTELMANCIRAGNAQMYEMKVGSFRRFF